MLVFNYMLEISISSESRFLSTSENILLSLEINLYFIFIA